MQVKEASEIQAELDWQFQNNAIAMCLDAADPNNFTNWRIIRHAMFSMPSRDVLKDLQQLPDWESRWKKVITESPVGNPQPYKGYPTTSGNLITMVLNLNHFLSATSCDLESLDTIFEFGGGYGCLCRLIHRLGFSGEYVNFDLPALINLQKYYLKRTVEGEITFLIDANELTDRFMTNHGKSLFVAMWSISEAPFALRERVLGAVCANIDYVFICFQSRHRELDNATFFEELVESHPQYQWSLNEVPHLVIANARHLYLCGERTK